MNRKELLQKQENQRGRQAALIFIIVWTLILTAFAVLFLIILG